MNFAELRFWELLMVGVVLALGLRWGLARTAKVPAWFDRAALMLIGLALLLAVSWVTFVIYLVVIATTYTGLAWIVRHHSHHARKWLVVLIPLQLAPLFYYKYADFAMNRVLGADLDNLRGLLIPIGISFYSFQLVGFVVDTLVFKQPLPRFLDCLNFAGFFPQLVAGPIERRGDLLPQMESFRFRWSAAGLDEGVGWIVAGLFFKCCLADNLAALFPQAPPDNPFLIWLANLMFGLRIYYDFAGYSLIAVGLGRCFGIRLTLNFLSPYCSASLIEFWRRWHVTLSQWFRDYVYAPLGGGRVRWWSFNIAVVFIVSGIWHGAGWNFILWGALHAAFIITNRLGGRLPVPRALAWSATMLAAFYAWLAFYELRPEVLLVKMKTLLTPAAYSPGALRSAIEAYSTGHGVVLTGLLALTAGTLLLEWLSLRRGGEPYACLRRPGVLVVLVVLTIWLAPGKDNGFIYFAF